MPRESYAAAVARHTAVMEECFDLVCQGPASGELSAIMKTFNASLLEVERLTRLRIEASDYEFQRRQGKELSALARIVAPRRG